MRPEDDSTYVTTLFELTGFEFANRQKLDSSEMSEMSVGRQKCQLDVKNVRNVSWTSEMSVGRHIRSDDQIRSDSRKEEQRSNVLRECY